LRIWARGASSRSPANGLADRLHGGGYPVPLVPLEYGRRCRLEGLKRSASGQAQTSAWPSRQPRARSTRASRWPSPLGTARTGTSGVPSWPAPRADGGLPLAATMVLWEWLRAARAS
jgi:hypothetical protein